LTVGQRQRAEGKAGGDREMARSREAKLAGRARDLQVPIRAVAAVHIATAYAFKMALKPRSAESRRGSFEV
jgi:hypothetical protein